MARDAASIARLAGRPRCDERTDTIPKPSRRAVEPRRLGADDHKAPPPSGIVMPVPALEAGHAACPASQLRRPHSGGDRRYSEGIAMAGTRFASQHRSLFARRSGREARDPRRPRTARRYARPVQTTIRQAPRHACYGRQHLTPESRDYTDRREPDSAHKADWHDIIGIITRSA